MKPKSIIENVSDLSLIVYQEEDVIKEWIDVKNQTSENPLENFKFICVSETDTQLIMCSDSDNTYIVFRGTSNLNDWMTNIDLGFKETNYGKFHSGFWVGVESVWMEIVSKLLLGYFRDKNIVIGGHSLGAGLGTILAYRLHAMYPVDYLITFGSPRCVHDETASLIVKRHLRFVNNNDTVTRVPPRVFGYGHKGELQYFTEDGDFSADPSSWSRFLDRIHGRIDDFGEWGTDGLKDHDMQIYNNLVRKVLTNEKTCDIFN